MRHEKPWLPALIMLGMPSCSANSVDYAAIANEIGQSGGTVPQSVKLAVAQMLRECHVPVQGRYIYVQFERGAGEAPYTLELSRKTSEDTRVTSCLAREAKALGIDQKLDLGEEPPPPPNSSATQ